MSFFSSFLASYSCYSTGTNACQPN